MQHLKEFSRFAEHYGRYSLVQQRVAKVLADRIGPYGRIVDIGCGGGAFFKAYKHPFISYFAVDLSPRMLQLHPDGDGVRKIVGNFDDPELYGYLRSLDFDILVSSSALQWSGDLALTLSRIASLKKPTVLAIFTSGTFATLHAVAGTSSPIRSKEETIDAIRSSFDAKIETLLYRLYFRDTLSMLRYIKRSGVSGGQKRLTYNQTRRVLKEYPLSYLEFEIVSALAL